MFPRVWRSPIFSDAFWQRAFHGDPEVLGHAISLRGEPYTVVGIMPRDFRSESPVDVWTPLRPSRHGEGGGSNYHAIARLKPGVSWTQAGEQLRSLSQALNADPGFSAGSRKTSKSASFRCKRAPRRAHARNCC